VVTCVTELNRREARSRRSSIGLVVDDVAAAFGQILGAVVLERRVVRCVVIVIGARNRNVFARHGAFVPAHRPPNPGGGEESRDDSARRCITAVESASQQRNRPSKGR
jgi:hypothetical protein